MDTVPGHGTGSIASPAFLPMNMVERRGNAFPRSCGISTPVNPRDGKPITPPLNLVWTFDFVERLEIVKQGCEDSLTKAVRADGTIRRRRQSSTVRISGCVFASERAAMIREKGGT